MKVAHSEYDESPVRAEIAMLAGRYGGPALDVGTGACACMALTLARRGLQVTAVDHASSAVRMAQERVVGELAARVEVPEWVARQSDALNLVQAAIYDQCRFNNGYPYILSRADEQAVILGEEREALEGMLVRAMARHGLPLPQLSRKAQQKQRARWRRRR